MGSSSTFHSSTKLLVVEVGSAYQQNHFQLCRTAAASQMLREQKSSLKQSPRATTRSPWSPCFQLRVSRQLRLSKSSSAWRGAASSMCSRRRSSAASLASPPGGAALFGLPLLPSVLATRATLPRVFDLLFGSQLDVDSQKLLVVVNIRCSLQYLSVKVFQEFTLE